MPDPIDALAATLPPYQPTCAIPPEVAVPGYEILSELGRGGMGVVYKARQVKADRIVALKMILAGGHAGDAERQRFQTEAEAVARLQHPGIVQVFEVGEHQGLPFFSLEFCDGGSLEKKLGGVPLPPADAARLVEEVAGAIQYAHERRVLHRDLKPANILLAPASGREGDWVPKVTDFGLAKKLDEAGQTATGAVMGTPSYMAPEQAGGRKDEVGPAADVYALGAILYECLTGRPPFRAATPLDTILQVVADEPAPPRQLNLGVPADLETICLKCLRKEPGRRYGSAGDLAEDVRRFRTGEPIAARPVGRLERGWKWARQRPATAATYVLLLTALVLGAGAGGVSLLWWRAEGALRRAENAESELQQANRTLTHYSYADRIGMAQREWDAGAVRRARDLLQEAADLQEGLTPGTRPWEWLYVRRVVHPEQLVLKGETDGERSVVFSRDGRRVATVRHARVTLWDVATGNKLAVVEGDSAAFSPGLDRLATTCEGRGARLWDVATGQLLTRLEGDTNSVKTLAFSPDGKTLAGGTVEFDARHQPMPGEVRLWHADTGTSKGSLLGHAAGVPSVTFSPDGKHLASAGRDRTVRLWDIATGKQLTVLRHRDGVESVAFSPGGDRIVSEVSNAVLLWEFPAGKAIATLEGTRTAPVFSPDGRLLAAGDNFKGVRVWDTASGARVAVLEGHTNAVEAVAFSPCGCLIVSAGQDKSARVWDVPSGRQLTVLRGHTEVVRSAAFYPDGSLLTTSGSDGTRLWDLAVETPLAILRGHTGHVQSVAFSPDGHLLASAGDTTVRLWSAHWGKQFTVLGGNEFFLGGVHSVAFSPAGGRIAAGGGHWSVEQGGLVRSYEGVRVWDAVSCRECLLLDDKAGTQSVCFSPDGSRLATTSQDDTVRVWDAVSGKQSAGWRVAVGTARGLAWSPDGKHVVTAGDGGGSRMWDAFTGSPVVTFKGSEVGAESVACSPDGSRVATGHFDGSVRLWDPSSGKLVGVLAGHTDGVTSVAFSPDGVRLASGASDGTRLWDTASGRQVASLPHPGGVLSVAFSPDGSRIATGAVTRRSGFGSQANARRSWRNAGTTIGNNRPTGRRPSSHRSLRRSTSANCSRPTPTMRT